MLELALTFLRRALFKNTAGSETRVLLLALAMAVASVGAVSLFAEKVQRSLKQQAAGLLGADVLLAFDKPVKEAAAPYLAEARRQGLSNTQSTRFMSMTGKVNDSNTMPVLTDVKAVQTDYPLRGRIVNRQGQALTGIPATQEVWIDERLADKLGAQTGTQVQLGKSIFTISNIFAEEPEIAGSFITMSPKLIMNEQALAATELLQLGNRASFRLHVAGDNSADYLAWVKSHPQTGMRVDTVNELRPEVRSTLERAEKFLSLTALLAVLLAAVAVVLATRRSIARELDQMALMRCLGASKWQLYQLLAVQFSALLVLALMVGLVFAYIGHGLLLWAFLPK
ncbi:MAG: hypothetical protein RLZZ502_1680 [Pseudomonadota bacterium]|jgi:putative ABC transport system permease protein